MFYGISFMLGIFFQSIPVLIWQPLTILHAIIIVTLFVLLILNAIKQSAQQWTKLLLAEVIILMVTLAFCIKAGNTPGSSEADNFVILFGATFFYSIALLSTLITKWLTKVFRRSDQ